MARKPKAVVFASAQQTIRASMLPSLFLCPRMFHDHTMREEGDSNDLADTGNLVHSGIHAYHTQRAITDKALMAAIAAVRDKFPLGNPDEAHRICIKYRNRDKEEKRGQVIECELEIKVTLPPVSYDKTQEEIVITGHVDQVRRLVDRSLYVCDMKNGRKAGAKIVKVYAPQLALYTVGVHQKYKVPCKAFILRTQDLLRSDLPFWWDMGFDEVGAMKILEVVRHRIAVIRNGALCSTPGEWCETYNCMNMQFPNCVTGEPVTQVKAKSGSVPLATVDELFEGFGNG